MTDLENRVFELEIKLEVLTIEFAKLVQKLNSPDPHYSLRSILDKLRNDETILRKKRQSDQD